MTQTSTKRIIDRETKKKVRKQALMDQILADAKHGAAQYVQNFNAGRGAE
jgi:hypothetical protein